MIEADFRQLLTKTVHNIENLATIKGGEYAGLDTDRLSNFKRNAVNLELHALQVWAVYAGKHWDAVHQFIRDTAAKRTRPSSEPIEGRIDDVIVYCVLLKALIHDMKKDTMVLIEEEFKCIHTNGCKNKTGCAIENKCAY